MRRFLVIEDRGILQKISKVLFGKGSAGMRLEVSFEAGSFFSGTKSKGVFDPPGPELRGVRDLPGIMGLEASRQILRQPCVMPGLVQLTDQDVDVVEGSHFISLPTGSLQGGKQRD